MKYINLRQFNFFVMFMKENLNKITMDDVNDLMNVCLI